MRRLILGVLLACSAAGAATWMWATGRIDLSRQDATSAPPMDVAYLSSALRRTNYMADDRAGTRPPSPWLDRRGERARGALEANRGTFDILVTPVQPVDQSIDGLGRSRVSYALSRALAERHGIRVPNPEVVALALLPGAPYVSEKSARALARQAGAGTAVVTHVFLSENVSELDDASAVGVTLEVALLNAAAAGSHTLRTWGPLPVTTERMPSDVVVEHIDEVADFIAKAHGKVEPPTSMAPSPRDGVETPALSPSLPALAARTPEDPYEHALVLSLLGVLTPVTPSGAREALFARVLSLLDDADIEPDRARLLRARALFYLHRLPYAEAALGAAGGDAPEPAEAALQGLLHGDAPAIARACDETGDRWHHLFCGVEYLRLASNHEFAQQVRTDFTKSLSAAHPGWAPFIAHAAFDDDPWAAPRLEAVHEVADEIYPDEGTSLLDLARSLGLQHGTAPDDIQIGAALLSRLDAIRDKENGSVNLLANPLRYAERDVREFLGSHAFYGMHLTIARELRTFGRPERAQALITRAREVLAGQPDFETLRADTSMALAEVATDSGRDALLREAYAFAHDAMHLFRDPSPMAARAFGIVQDTGAHADPRKPAVHATTRFGLLFPPRSYWPHFGPQISRYARPWEFEHANSWPLYKEVNRLLKADSVDEAEALLARHRDRYVSDPYRIGYQASYLNQRGRRDQAHALYIDEIARGSARWEPYLEVGRRQIMEGRFDDAQETFLSYPQFGPDSSANRVGISNNAAEAGTLLYVQGAWPQALRLYEIPLALQTGAASQYIAGTRSALVKGDWQAAMAYALTNARRYDSATAYRHVASILFALGHAAQARPLLLDRLRVTDNPVLWSAAAMALRMEGKAGRALLERAIGFTETSSPRLRSTTNGFVAGVLLQDRDVMSATVLLLESLSRERGEKIHRFAEVYAAIFSGKHGEAVQLAQSDLERYAAQEWPASAELFPLAAYAALRSGDLSLVRQVRDARKASFATYYKPDSERFFDDALVDVVLAAGDGDADGALARLRYASAIKPRPGGRILAPAYQLAEFSEWLFEATGDVRFRTYALDWARAWQRIQPFDAWAYAMEAAHTDSKDHRIRAGAIAQYLDPQSRRLLARFDDAALAETRAWFTAHNPFKLPEAEDTAQAY